MAPLVEEMLQRIGGEVGRYERVIAYWHVFGPLLEGAVCASLRETTGAVTRQCGLSQVWPHEYLSSNERIELQHYMQDASPMESSLQQNFVEFEIFIS